MANQQLLVYFSVMKLLILFLVLAISIQPLQAGFCDMDMEKDQEMSHHMDSSTKDGHDCCDTKASDQQQDGCGDEMNCGSCLSVASALLGMTKASPTWDKQHLQGFASGALLPSHSSLPLRPPIS